MHQIFVNTNISKDLYYMKDYKKNDLIFYEGEECDRIGFVDEGVITIRTTTYSGKDYEINEIHKDSLFGEFLLFSNENKYLGTAIASRNTRVIYFTKENLLTAFKDRNFLLNYLNLTSFISKKVQRKVKVLSQSNLKDKIMFLLYDNYKKTKCPYIDIVNQESLASFLCVSRPSLTRVLISLNREGLINYDRYHIELVLN